MGDSRTFSFLGPNNANLSVFMGGSQTMDDATTLGVWGFRSTDGLQDGFNDNRVVPSPVIELIEGQPGAITLSTGLPHSIHLHGLDTDQANDGVPQTSGFVANGPGPFFNNFGRVGGYPRIRNSVLDNRFTYNFIAPHAGTYLYHCHVDTALHMERGMAGTIIVRPPNGSATQAYANGPTFEREYLWHLHAYDSRWHGEVVSGLDPMAPDTERVTARYRPDYFMINGKDTTPVVTDSTVALAALGGERVMLRVNNIGYLPATVRLGGMSFTVIASDGRPLQGNLTTTELLIAPAERYELIFSMPENFTGNATVEYHDIRFKGVLSTVATTITGGQNSVFRDGFET